MKSKPLCSLGDQVCPRSLSHTHTHMMNTPLQTRPPFHLHPQTGKWWNREDITDINIYSILLGLNNHNYLITLSSSSLHVIFSDPCHAPFSLSFSFSHLPTTNTSNCIMHKHTTQIFRSIHLSHFPPLYFEGYIYSIISIIPKNIHA